MLNDKLDLIGLIGRFSVKTISPAMAIRLAGRFSLDELQSIASHYMFKDLRRAMAQSEASGNESSEVA